MQNWVCTNWAPALALAASALGSQPAGGSIGRSAAPRKKAALPATVRPVGSTASSRRRRAVSISVLESRSNTGLVSGWSPAFGSSPPSRSRLRMPSAAAPINSPCSARRFRSRQVICRIGSISAPIRIAAAASAPIWARAPAPSVTLTASASPRSGAALRMRSCASQDSGGVTSAVMTKRPARSRSSNVRGSRALWSFIAGSLTGARRRQSAYMLCGVTAIAAFLDRKHQCR